MNKMLLKSSLQSYFSTEKMSYKSPETISTDKIEQCLGNSIGKKEVMIFFCKQV